MPPVIKSLSTGDSPGGQKTKDRASASTNKPIVRPLERKRISMTGDRQFKVNELDFILARI